MISVWSENVPIECPQNTERGENKVDRTQVEPLLIRDF